MSLKWFGREREATRCGRLGNLPLYYMPITSGGAWIVTPNGDKAKGVIGPPWGRGTSVPFDPKVIAKIKWEGPGAAPARKEIEGAGSKLVQYWRLKAERNRKYLDAKGVDTNIPSVTKLEQRADDMEAALSHL